MTGTFKGLFKGIRYFSQIFDSKEEEEMQIGVPTDVKHVSHIGWDGSSSNAPSWMGGFKSVPELANETSSTIVESNKAAKTFCSEGTQDSKNEKPKNKTRSKATAGNDLPPNSPKRSDGPKQSRCNFTKITTVDSSKGNDSPLNSPGPDGTKKSRRHLSVNTTSDFSKEHQHNVNLSIESSSPKPNGIPKQSRRKKVKGATCEGSTKSFGADSGKKTKNKHRELSSVVEENGEETG